MEADHPAIVGRVTRADGEPMPSTALTLSDLQGRQLGQGRADADGDYRLLPPSGGSYIVICSAAGHHPRAAVVSVGAETTRHDVTLAGTSRLGGTVRLGETDEAVPAAVVTLLDLHGTVVAAEHTGPDGSYGFDDLIEGSYTLTAMSAEHQPVATAVTVPPAATVVRDLTMAQRARLSGAVVSATTGKPVDEALVTLLDATGSVVAAAATGADGTYAFDDLPTGVYTLTATGYPPVATEVHLPAGSQDSTDIALKPPLADA